MSLFTSPLLGYLDNLYAKSSSSPEHKFFVDGLGDTSTMVAVDAKFAEGLAGFASLTLEPHADKAKFAESDTEVFRFESPLAEFLPEESKTGYVMLVKPAAGMEVKGVVVLLAATGDAGFSQRKKNVADKLAKSGIATLILEIAFYGRRRPEGQTRHYLREASLVPLQGAACSIEGALLVRYSREELYPGVPVCLAGTSFGGAMAARSAVLTLQGSDTDEALGLCTLVAPNSPESFLSGSLRSQINVDVLDEKTRVFFQGYSVLKLAQSHVPAPRRQRLVVTSIRAKHDKIVVHEESKALAQAVEALGPAQVTTCTVSGGHVSAIMRTKSLVPGKILDTFAAIGKLAPL